MREVQKGGENVFKEMGKGRKEMGQKKEGIRVGGPGIGLYRNLSSQTGNLLFRVSRGPQVEEERR